MEKLFKTFKGIIKSVDENEYIAEVIVSTDTVDRDKDKINTEAFRKRLKYYKQHPVLLSSHNYGDLRKQIGEATDIKVTDEGLKAKFKYYVGEGNPEADWAWVLAIKNIAGYSIGFIPFAYDEKDLEKDGYLREYTDVELVEISQVLVPSNREAVQVRRQAVTNLNETEKELLELAIKGFDKGELKELVTKPEPDVTENYIRMRVRNPDLFVDDSFRTIWLAEKEGIKAVIGKLKSDPDGSTHIQSVLFDKDKWTMEEAKEWMKEHQEDLKELADIAVKDIVEREIKEFSAKVMKVITDNIDALMEIVKEKIKTDKVYLDLLFGDKEKSAKSLTKQKIVDFIKQTIKE